MTSKPSAFILGVSGKLGTALRAALSDDFEVSGTTSADVDAQDPRAVESLVHEQRPALLANCVAKMGIDACEQDPVAAFRLNTLLPAQLAAMSRQQGFKLLHFSTDSVFADHHDGAGGYFTENDAARPLNTYGITKYGGDCHVQARADNYYVVRVSLMFGPSAKANQFLERMLARAAGGQTLNVSHDIILSPSYSVDIAERVQQMLRQDVRPGLYHVANAGRPSLFDLVSAAVQACGFPVEVRPVSHESFSTLGLKNKCTPISSAAGAPLRPWREALHAYCSQLQRSDSTRLA